MTPTSGFPAFLTPHGTAGQVLVATYSGRLPPLSSTVIIDEYRAVLSRSRFNIEPGALTAFVDLLHVPGHLDVGAPSLPPEMALPDPSDAPFIELVRYEPPRNLRKLLRLRMES